MDTKYGNKAHKLLTKAIFVRLLHHLDYARALLSKGLLSYNIPDLQKRRSSTRHAQLPPFGLFCIRPLNVFSSKSQNCELIIAQITWPLSEPNFIVNRGFPIFLKQVCSKVTKLLFQGNCGNTEYSLKWLFFS